MQLGGLPVPEAVQKLPGSCEAVSLALPRRRRGRGGRSVPRQRYRCHFVGSADVMLLQVVGLRGMRARSAEGWVCLAAMMDDGTRAMMTMTIDDISMARFGSLGLH